MGLPPSMAGAFLAAAAPPLDPSPIPTPAESERAGGAGANPITDMMVRGKGFMSCPPHSPLSKSSATPESLAVLEVDCRATMRPLTMAFCLSVQAGSDHATFTLALTE